MLFCLLGTGVECFFFLKWISKKSFLCSLFIVYFSNEYTYSNQPTKCVVSHRYFLIFVILFLTQFELTSILLWHARRKKQQTKMIEPRWRHFYGSTHPHQLTTSKSKIWNFSFVNVSKADTPAESGCCSARFSIFSTSKMDLFALFSWKQNHIAGCTLHNSIDILLLLLLFSYIQMAFINLSKRKNSTNRMF